MTSIWTYKLPVSRKILLSILHDSIKVVSHLNQFQSLSEQLLIELT